MAHAPARRRSAPGDEADHGLLAAALGFVFQKLRGILFRRAADLADHDQGLGRLIGKKHFQHLDEVSALYGIAADADRGGLAEPFPRGLEHRLVGQRAGARDDADLAGLENIARHDADLAFARGHDAGAIRPDQARFGAAQRTLDLDHVADRNAFGDAHDQRNLRRDRLGDGIGGAGRRHIDHAGIGAGLLARFVDGVEYRQVEMGRAAFAGRYAADHFCPVGDRLLGMEGAVLAGETLADDFGIFVDEDGHYAASFTALTIFCAASSRSSAEVTLRFDLAMMSLPRSTLVPSSRTTSGTRKPTSFTAATTPSAITSHFMMPPKMLTRMPFTLWSDVMILKAAATLSFVALPPTSKKLAGA